MEKPHTETEIIYKTVEIIWKDHKCRFSLFFKSLHFCRKIVIEKFLENIPIRPFKITEGTGVIRFSCIIDRTK